jgi:hypothetical protein
VRVAIDERMLRKQLEEIRRQMESWDRGRLHETAGRCLRWLGESEEAAEQFRIAATNYNVGNFSDEFDLLYAGNLYRLAGTTTRHAPSSLAAVTCCS